MNAKTGLLTAALVLSLLFALTVYAQKQERSKVAWDYHVWNYSTWQEATGKLSEEGNQGWELVAVTEIPIAFDGGYAHSGSVTLYLRRAR